MPIRRKVTKKKATKKRAVRKVAKKRAVRKVAKRRAVRWEPGRRKLGEVASSEDMGEILEGLGFDVRYKKSRRPGMRGFVIGGIGNVLLQTEDPTKRLMLTVEFDTFTDSLGEDWGSVEYRISIGYADRGTSEPLRTTPEAAQNILEPMTDALEALASRIDFF
jgi:hypothetical protein